MRSRLALSVLAGLLAFLGSPAAAQSITADLTASISPTGFHWNDDRLRAYSSGTVADGFMMFDLSGIPDGAFISALTLTTFHEGQFGSPIGLPSVAIYEVASDSWTRTSGSPTLGNAVSGSYTSFPSGDLAAFTWTLDPTAINWAAHLSDNVLSLAMHNSTSGSYVYWHGSDNPQATPQLTFQIGAAAGVPEPATWAMMLLGFGAVGFSMRRSARRRGHFLQIA